MQISFNWLKQHVKLPDSVSAEEVAEKLKLSTVEVEAVTNMGAALDGVVIGKVLTVEKHPNADKLQVCKVDVGSEQVTIVCGGSNVVPNMTTVVAKIGAKVKWHGEGELVELKPTLIRGVESFGMICGADEVGLTDIFPKKSEKEIVDASSLKLKPGTPAAVAFGKNDAILEIDNKSLSNRPDLWGHYGLAREVAVLFNREVKPYKVKPIVPGKTVKLKVKIEEPKMCSRYLGVAVGNITIGESPTWLKERLVAAGIRPINNIVDITNFVMLDIGQPMHAFDVRELQNGAKDGAVEIVVKRAAAGQKFKTLDEVERTLSNDTLLIATPHKTLAIAGVMGGQASAVATDTKTIVFEAATFDATAIRKVTTKLGLRTDASARFEKSLDPTLCTTALERAVELVQEMCPGAVVVSAVAEAGSVRLFKGPIVMPKSFIGSRLGQDISIKTIIKILERLGFAVEEIEKDQTLSITIPSWRATRDIRIAEDIVEEIARINGYDKIVPSMPIFGIAPPAKDTVGVLGRTVGDCLAHDFGFNEVYTYSFVSAGAIEKAGESVKEYLELDNPLSKEKPFIRRHLLLNLLETAAQNAHAFDPVKIFEIGTVFHSDAPGLRVKPNSSELLPRQDIGFTALFTEQKNNNPWSAVRAVVERLEQVLGGAWKITVPSHMLPFFHPARTAEIVVNGEIIGHVFEVHPKVVQNFKLEQKVAAVTVNCSRLQEVLAKNTTTRYSALSVYPEVNRDVAFLVKKEVTYESVSRLFTRIDPLLKDAELFDVYEGDKLKAGFKSMAFHLTYGSNEKTLTTEEIDAAHKKVEQALKEILTAEIRT